MKTKDIPFVCVGLSGGVDSSVAAWKLLQEGFRVEGIFMRNWAEDDAHCPMTQDLADARAVAAKLNIPIHVVDFSKRYWEEVFEHFLDEYAKGRTPNPDILCNTHIKFEALLKHVQADLGADYLATGHYAQKAIHHGLHYLKKAKDTGKDQTYFLHGLSQAQLKPALFPLGDMKKSDVRAIATGEGLVTADKKDSTGICFIGERRFKPFLEQYLWHQPGEIRQLETEKVLGKHTGLMYYTLGQRQGLHIGGQKNITAPWYVAQKDRVNNVLYVVAGNDHPTLYAKTLHIGPIHWIAEPPSQTTPLFAKIRYRHSEDACHIDSNTPTQVHFETPQWAPTPGQSIVFYDEAHCLGGAIIEGGV